MHLTFQQNIGRVDPSRFHQFLCLLLWNLIFTRTNESSLPLILLGVTSEYLLDSFFTSNASKTTLVEYQDATGAGETPTIVAMEPCRFFAKGTCRFGASCRKSHAVAKASFSESTSHNTNVTAPSTHDRTTAPKEHENYNRPCKFFSEGRCMYGESCKYQHPVTEETPSSPNTTNQLRPGAKIFNPTMDRSPRGPCLFFQRGTCRNGDQCPFLHGTAGADTLSKDLPGAKVTFKEGVIVSEVELSSDCSSIQLTDLPSMSQLQSVIELLAQFGFQIQEADIQIKSMRSGCTATVKLDSRESASRAVETFTGMFKGDNGELSIKAVPNVSRLGNSLQLSSVTCSWPRPNRKAKLWFQNFETAEAARILFENNGRVLSRKVTANVISSNIADTGDGFILRLKNLDPATEYEHLERVLRTHTYLDLRPTRHQLQHPTSMLSDEDSASMVEESLRDIGGLEHFQLHPVAERYTRLKATASFSRRDSATRAIQELHSNNAQLIVTRNVSTKFNVATNIIEAIQEELSEFQRECKTDDVKVTIHPTDSRLFTNIRLSATRENPFATAKTVLDRLLLGTILMDGDRAIWDGYFLCRDGLEYLNKLSKEQNVYIRRDHRILQLHVYGDTPLKRAFLERQLISKVDSISKSMHTIHLHQLAAKNIRDGFRKLREQFGNAATLINDAFANPQSILLYGSLSDSQKAHALLFGDPSNQDEVLGPGTTDCSVCWSDPTAPLEASCGHIYCKQCFINAAETAPEKLPFKCLGEQDSCAHLFSMTELKSLLPLLEFEKLLQGSFTQYIRENPKEFQYCPTPDCPCIYRPTEDGTLFTCPSCFSEICTTCNVPSHPSITCMDWKENHADSGVASFERWLKEHGKRCPKCSAALEKADGCNHMHCGVCKVHICWVCMETFEDADGGDLKVYDHMRERHQGYYDPDDPNNPEQVFREIRRLEMIEDDDDNFGFEAENPQQQQPEEAPARAPNAMPARLARAEQMRINMNAFPGPDIGLAAAPPYPEPPRANPFLRIYPRGLWENMDELGDRLERAGNHPDGQPAGFPPRMNDIPIAMPLRQEARLAALQDEYEEVRELLAQQRPAQPRHHFRRAIPFRVPEPMFNWNFAARAGGPMQGVNERPIANLQPTPQVRPRDGQTWHWPNDDHTLYGRVAEPLVGNAAPQNPQQNAYNALNAQYGNNPTAGFHPHIQQVPNILHAEPGHAPLVQMGNAPWYAPEEGEPGYIPPPAPEN